MDKMHQEKEQKKVKSNKKKFWKNKQLIISFLAGMVTMLFVVGLIKAVDPGFLTGYIFGEPDDYSDGFSYSTSTGSITKYDGNATDLIIPDTIKKTKIVEISATAFLGCYTLSSVEIPYGVTNIGVCAFYGCMNLKSVIIPPSVKNIDVDAFNPDDHLTIYGVKESQAYYYAVEHGFDFSEIDQ